MTLNEVMKDTADAIREKKGTTDLIAHVNFAEEIKGITSGGGESGGSSYIYYDQKKTILNIRDLWKRSSTVKINFNGQTMILHSVDVLTVIEEEPSIEKAIIAVCIDPNIKICLDPTEPLLTWIEQDPGTFEYVNEVRITEEEYFNLNV
jgi:hypothetical protein